MTSTAARRNTRVVVGCIVTALIVGGLGLAWWSSLLPDSYSAMGMGHADFGGGPADAVHAAHGGHGSGGAPPQPGDVSVDGLTGPEKGTPDVAVTLVARAGAVALTSGTGTAEYTLNGSSPGPEIRARQGDLVEVTLVNESVAEGVTLHWHGVDLPNAEDGVAGVTQDAVPPGDTFTYRFVAEDAGTFWYHSHQVADPQVKGGLFGVLVIEPDDGVGVDHDVVVAAHAYGGVATVNGVAGEQRMEAAPGETVRARVVNTDNEARQVWVAGADYLLVGVDGRDVNSPTPVSGMSTVVPAGGRADLEFTIPDDGSAARVGVGAASLVAGPDGARPPPNAEPGERLDLLTYGSPEDIGFDPANADRAFEYRIGRRPGFLDGRPGLHWTINGNMYPDIPMYVVSEGDVVRMTISNSNADDHPMHLHGHHAVVLSRNGEPATGSPWWTDSLEVSRGETYEIAFVADNPGIWMDHCHNLAHAMDGLVAHLAYSGVYTPYRIGGPTGNEPE